MLKNFGFLPSFLAVFAFSLISCEKNPDPLVIPAAYNGTNYSTNTSTQYDLRARMAALVTEIKKGRSEGVILDYNTLLQLYTNGTPSLNNHTTDYYYNRLAGTGNWLNELANASGNIYVPGTPAGQGGTFGGYLFDENGLELEQMVEKGLFGAAMYNHAVNLMKVGNLTPANVDQLLAIYGAHPDFPNTPTAANASNPDQFMAGYAARRDKNDGQGLYTQIKNGFLKLQAAVDAGDDYNKERDEALIAIRTSWEKANFATVINYCYSVISTMSATNPSDSDKAKALHAYSECVGFVHGWRTISQDYKIISDNEIDEILLLLNAPQNGLPSSYKFVTDPLNELPKLTQVIQKLQTKYQFTNQEMEDFKKNWVTEQGR